MKKWWKWAGANFDRIRGFTQSIQVAIAMIALMASGMFALYLGAMDLSNAKTESGLAQLGAGLVLLFASTIHRFELLKGLGMEARTRELKHTINQAEDVLKKVHHFSRLAGAQLLELRYSHAQAPEASSPEGYANAMEIRRLLEEAGADVRSVLVALQPWIRRAALELFLVQLKAIGDPVTAVRAAIQQQAQFGENDDVKTKARARLQALPHFDPMTLLVSARGWDSKELEAKTRGLAQVIAVLPAPQQHGLESQLQGAIEQLNYLIDTGDFKDKRFWTAVAAGQ